MPATAAIKYATSYPKTNRYAVAAVPEWDWRSEEGENFEHASNHDTNVGFQDCSVTYDRYRRKRRELELFFLSLVLGFHCEICIMVIGLK